jgi:hypothetical protein
MGKAPGLGESTDIHKDLARPGLRRARRRLAQAVLGCLNSSIISGFMR